MRREYSGSAFASVLTVDLAGSGAALTIFCDDLTNWPDGTVGPFYVVVDRGLAGEEKILCVSRSGNALTVYDDGITNGRGADGTSVSAHTANAVVEHVFTATDADEANSHVNATTGVHGAAGAVVGTTDTQVLTNKTLTSPTINGGAINATTLAVGSKSVMPYALAQSVQSGTTYTFTLADATRLTVASAAAAKVFTIPPQSSVTWLSESIIRGYNSGAGALTFDGGVGVTVTNAAITIAQYQSFALIRTGSDAWTVIPFSGGASAPTVDEGSSTNATFSTLTNPDGDGKNYRLAKWTSSGTLAITTAGTVQALLVQGGQNGGGGTNNTGVGGQGGNVLYLENLYLDSGTKTVTVGNGSPRATAVSSGGHSSIGTVSTSDGRALPGGVGGNRGAPPMDAGQRGVPCRITGTTVNYAGGGGSGGGSANNGSQAISGSGGANGYSSTTAADGQDAVANTGGGGGGFWNVGTYNGGAGGSGVVLVRWEI